MPTILNVCGALVYALHSNVYSISRATVSKPNNEAQNCSLLKTAVIWPNSLFTNGQVLG